MSMLGNVKAGSWFTTLQSAAGSGHGAPVVAGIVRAGTAVSLVAVEYRHRKRREGPKLWTEVGHQMCLRMKRSPIHWTFGRSQELMLREWDS